MKLVEIKDQKDSPSSENNQEDNFPEGMRVLAIDDDSTCLRLLEKLLEACRYKVTVTNEASAALELLKNHIDNFDIVVTDARGKPGQFDGLRLLEIIGLEMDIPVVMTSSADDTNSVMKAIEHGACDYLVKPVRLQEIKNIWQHVVRKTKFDFEELKVGKEAKPEPVINKVKRGREGDNTRVDESTTRKKPRFNWTREMHAKFIAAVNELGVEKAVPSKIVEKMKVDGLTREQAASHLQKFRSGLKKSRGHLNEENNATSTIRMNEHISSSTTQLSFNNQFGFNGVSQLHGSRISNFNMDGIIHLDQPVQRPETFSNSLLTPNFSSHSIAQSSNLPYRYPQAIQALHPNQRIQVPVFGNVQPNLMNTGNLQPQLCQNELVYPPYPPRTLSGNYNVGNGNCSDLFADLCKELPNDSAIIPIEMNTTAHSNLQAVENIFPAQSEEDFILSDPSLLEEHAIDHFETDNILSRSGSSSSDGDLSALIERVES